MSQHWTGCQTDMKTEHSDTEIGRCVIRNLNTECVSMPEYFHQVYHTRVDGRLMSRKMKGLGAHGDVNKQMSLVFAREPFHVHFQAAFVHSFKFATDVERFYGQTRHYLRPMQPPLLKEQESTKYVEGGRHEQHRAFRLFNYWARQTCVHNPAAQRERYGTTHAECPPRQAASPTAEVDLQTAVVFSAWPRDSKAIAQLHELEVKLISFGIRAHVVDVLRYKGDSEEDMARAMASGAYVLPSVNQHAHAHARPC